jgi:nucleoside-diphosphate-sugar epimerase
VRVFVAGATGVIGRRLVPLLVQAGHEVTGMTRSSERAQTLRESGVTPAVADALDAGAVREAVAKAQPEVIVHQLTDIPAALNPRRYAEQMAGNDRLRAEGTQNLVDAAPGTRIVGQSVAFAYRPTGTALWSEEDPLYLDAPGPFKRSVDALAELERQVAGTEGVVLRYGYFYGPGTIYAKDGHMAQLVQRRRLPVVGRDGATWSFIHVDDAARATLAALDADVKSGVYNVVDDDPAPVREWIPAFAQAVGAPEPRWAPTWLARIAAGQLGVYFMTGLQGASNAKARLELSWEPQIPSWREGFRDAL